MMMEELKKEGKRDDIQMIVKQCPQGVAGIVFVQGMYGGTLRKRGEREAKVGMRASFWLAH